LTAGEIRAQLERIRGSREFSRVERLRRFLAFVVEEAIEGRGDDLKECVIGHQVCGRPETYDPKRDPIVRVDANRLRARLAAYYEAEGAADGIRIHIPKGGYSPVFELRSPAARHVAGAEALAEYRRGIAYWNLRTPESLDRSVQCHQGAIRIEPLFGAAYAGLANAYTVMALNDLEQTPALMLKARSASRRAIELEPDSPEALVSLGTVKSIFDWDWEGGALAFERSLCLSPDSAAAHYLYAIVNLQPRARWEAALAHMRVAIEAEPASPVLLRDLGIIHFMRHGWEEALRHLDAAESLDPSFRGTLFWRARALIELGRPREAIGLLRRRMAAGDANTRVTSTLAYAAARAGHRAVAVEVRRQLLEHARSRRVAPLDLVFVSLALEDIDGALHWLTVACQERAAPLYQFGVDPIYAPLRADPRSGA
jgi:tetratricopeptide (TPR) repeat protein